jgi:[protein-PII] uridylyltransferase
LLAMIPEFAPVVGRVHHDLYHVYTVDVHSVAAVDRLRALLRGELAEEHSLAHRLAGEVDRPHVLCLATLLHDVGKAIGGSGHARRGSDMARVILARMGFSPEDNEAACQLVSKHLKLYLSAVRRDLEDPSTLAEFVRDVQGRAGLRDLYLLTVVDLSTTSPTSMTKWKAGMLDALFHASDAQLCGTSRTEPGWLARIRAQIKDHWASQNDAAFLNEFIDTMPERYLLSNSAAEITAHARVAQRLAGNPVSAALVPSRHADVAELCVVTAAGPAAGLCVVTDDRPGLLAAIAAVITAGRLEIHAAQIHSRVLANGSVQAVDLFWVRSPDGAEGARDALPKLQRDLEQVVTGRIAPKELLKRKTVSRWSDRPLPMVPTEVVIDHDASAEHSVIEVLTKDRPGLLFMLAQELHELGVSIGVAKISTEGSRVSDVFYVTEFDGRKLEAGARTRTVREGLLKLLGAPRAQA